MGTGVTKHRQDNTDNNNSCAEGDTLPPPEVSDTSSLGKAIITSSKTISSAISNHNIHDALPTLMNDQLMNRKINIMFVAFGSCM